MSARHPIGPAVAGQWYPASPFELREEVERLLGEARGRCETPTAGRPMALIAPHAGYTYSGRVAACAFLPVGQERYSRVVLLGPSHYAGFHGGMLPDADAYRTPLGDVLLDVEALDPLRAQPGFATDNRPYRPEHSLEAEIPFLQLVLEAGWKLVPVLIGGGSMGPDAQRVADGVKLVLGPDTLVVVSSDFTHYGIRFGYVPFESDVPQRIGELDMGAIRRIEALDTAGFEEYVARTGATICGRDAIDVLLRMLPATARAGLVAYDTSGRMTGDWAHSVSYASIAFAMEPGKENAWAAP